MNPGDARLLRLYLNNNDRVHGKPLYEAVVAKAREMGLAGASVFTAEMGYGTHRVIHDDRNEYTFIGAPVVVEVVDREERIDSLLVELEAMVGEAFVTVCPVQVAHYVHLEP
jgi:PII-like signaling protein